MNKDFLSNIFDKYFEDIWNDIESLTVFTEYSINKLFSDSKQLWERLKVAKMDDADYEDLVTDAVLCVLCARILTPEHIKGVKPKELAAYCSTVELISETLKHILVDDVNRNIMYLIDERTKMQDEKKVDEREKLENMSKEDLIKVIMNTK